MQHQGLAAELDVHAPRGVSCQANSRSRNKADNGSARRSERSDDPAQLARLGVGTLPGLGQKLSASHLKS